MKYETIIHTIVRDEEHILNEWIVYHLLIGFEHIFIYDDLSTKLVIDVVDVIPSEFKQKVSVYRLNEEVFDENKFRETEFYDEELYSKFNGYKQKYILNYFLKHHKTVANWCFFCDVDEFLVINNDKKLKEILAQYNQFDCLSIPWLQFGSSYFIDNPKGLITENFRHHDSKYHFRGKSINKLSKLNEIQSCHIVGSNVYEFDSRAKLFSLPFHINHYRILSVKTFISRKLRGELSYRQGNARAVKDILKLMLSFNKIQTETLKEHLTELRKILKSTPPPFKEIDEDNSFCNVIKYGNSILHEGKNASYKDLKDILQKPARFCNISELLPPDFDVDYYKRLNPDLSFLTNEKAELHFCIWGEEEERIYNLDSGKIKNKDIVENLEKRSTPSEKENYIISLNAHSHFKRYLPDDFDVNVYKEIYSHLKYVSDIQAINDYRINLNHRVYNLDVPDEFDVNEYRREILDNIHLSDIKVKILYKKEKENQT